MLKLIVDGKERRINAFEQKDNYIWSFKYKGFDVVLERDELSIYIEAINPSIPFGTAVDGWFELDTMEEAAAEAIRNIVYTDPEKYDKNFLPS